MKNLLSIIALLGLLFSTKAQAQNLAYGKTTSASTNNQPSANAVDANGNTRWESASSDPQWMAVDLGSVQTIDRVRLTWENAYGKDFTIQVSTNGTAWTTVATTTNNATTLNEYNNLAASGRYVRMYGTARATPYGYSIYEIEVYNSTPAFGSNLALGKPGTASSTQGGFPPAQAFDGDINTRWGSNHNDGEWLYVDLGKAANISGVTLIWETAYGKDFRIEVSSNATSWTMMTTITNNTLHANELTVSGTGRYVRMYGVTRGTGYGFSLYEMRVYGTFVPVAPLPVELSKFVAAERSGKAVSVNWATASEKNSQSFAVQRSANGKEFTTLGTVAATGTSAAPHAYAFTDAAPLSGVNYYRLLQLDADGTVSYSPTATVRLNLVAAPAEAYPNPVIDRVSITSTAVGSATQWSLTNSRGQVVHTEALSAAAEAGRVELDLQPYAAGYYIVSLLADGQVLSRTKVVKGQ